MLTPPVKKFGEPVLTGMHVNAPKVGDVVLATPAAVMPLPMTPLSVKHCRKRNSVQVSPDGQSPFVKQGWNLWIAHHDSPGPAAQTPSLLESVSAGFAEHTPSSQSFGLVQSPGMPQNPLGHSEDTAQGVPLFGPPWQRLPPQTLAPTAMHSSSV
jgi:hypothetical protein